ncbi:MAG TPA: putative sulfate exporter family transporter, partial [Candidatus Baltobacteraceae bacterium]
KADPAEIWRRFPKFVLGFLVASVLISALSHQLTYSDFSKTFTTDLITPIKTLRTWVFTFCFLSIGLTVRIRDLAAAGERPFWAFSSGVAINVILGFILSAMVFGKYWTGVGR